MVVSLKFGTSDIQILKQSGIFDASWYVERYPDVAILDMDPLEHFIWLGAALKRDPGPKFDRAYYVKTHEDVVRNNFDSLLHYLRYGLAEGRKARQNAAAPTPKTGTEINLDRTIGGVAARPERLTVLVCSHVAGNNLFGGERSFVDMIDGLDACGYNVIVTVPGRGNASYFEILRNKSQAIYTLPYGWWYEGVTVNDGITAQFARIIADEGVDVVHANTIMLREPLIAARRVGVRSIIHVRELIHHDTALLNLIGEAPDCIVDRVWANSDHVIANSKATRDGFTRPGKVPSLVYNTADFRELNEVSKPTAEGPMRVGLISSNLPKKGIGDFAKIALDLSQTHPDVLFHLIGPATEHTAKLMAQIADGCLPNTLKLLGYRETPAEAIAEADVILSLSNFKESFGRTVLEGMAAGRPAIVYDYGAPPELVQEGKTGFVVPLGDTEAVASLLRRLADDRTLLQKIGKAAKMDVQVCFSHEVYAKQMCAAYETLISQGNVPKKMKLAARRDLNSTPRDQLKVAYFCWHFPVPSETFVLNELRLLVAQGHDVTVFCKQIPYPDFKPDFDITWERVRDSDHLAERLIETDRTIVHAHFVYPTVTNMVWPACEKANMPFTCIAHAQDVFRYKSAAENRIDEWSLSPMCRKIFTLSNFHRNYLEDCGVPANKIIINSNCIDPDLFVGGKIGNRKARKSRSICAVSRFAEKKGLEHLIRAGMLLKHENITINIYGYGELEDNYRNLIKESGAKNVYLHGPVKGRNALMEVFRNHDLFACPSVRAADGDMDGIPTTLMEAFAAGLPVLTTDIAGIPDLVSDKVTGFVCDANPEAIAAEIRAFYKWPDARVQSLIENAEERLRRNHHGSDLIDTLVRVWAHETIDLLIVSWNNLDEIKEVTRRLYKYTSLPFHLIICDNGSGPELLTFLMHLYADHDNVTLILNRDNAFVGPGTNICLENSTSEYAIYVCGKEGMTTRYGWEKPFVTYMKAHPKVGLAGTLCYSPSYLFGRDYPTAQPLFDKFRNRDFALLNADRMFAHVQGGFFIMRRAMINQIGGFSDDVPHSSTDVEFSYYVESRGWELGKLPGMIALYNKTRPGLFHRIDEHMGALHPPTLDNLPALDAISKGVVHHCNACGKQSDKFADLDGVARCPKCGATRRERTLHRILAESMLLYRRLPALSVNLPPALEPFWTHQFQGLQIDATTLLADQRNAGRTDFADGRLNLVLLNDALTENTADTTLLAESARVLIPGGTLIVSGLDAPETLIPDLNSLGFGTIEQRRYASRVSQYDWRTTLVCEKNWD